MHHIIVSQSNLMARWSFDFTAIPCDFTAIACELTAIACDFSAISGSVDSTTSLANGFYVPHMV